MKSGARYFLDSSALVKLYVEERGSDRVEEIVSTAGRGGVAISRLAVVEVTSALVRRMRSGDISEEDLANALGFLEHDTIECFEVAELGGVTISRAVDIVRRNALRAADAIQLACALLTRREQNSTTNLTLVSSDRELNIAAKREHLLVMDPAS